MRSTAVRFTLAIILLTLLANTGVIGCQGDTPASLEPEGTLEKVNIFNAPAALRPGEVHVLGATGIYSGLATFNITGIASWVSSDNGVIEIIGQGILRTVGPGEATITASYKGVTSQLVVISVEGTPIPGSEPPAPITLDSVKITPASGQISIGETLQFEAEAIFSNGVTQDITAIVDWRVSDGGPGFIIDQDNQIAYGPFYGQFRGAGLGATTVSAAYQGLISNYATVNVVQ